MSPADEASGGRRPASSGWRIVAALALLGLLLGFGWGIADQPIYSATASVAVASDSEGADISRLERFAQRGESQKVADTAAVLLGDDVAGADLLAEVSVRPAPAGGAVIVTATSETPDFAAAAADSFAQALVKVEGDPLQLGAAASIPSSPSENRPAGLWALIGLLVGAMVGLLIMLALSRSQGRGQPARRVAEPVDAPAIELVGLVSISKLLEDDPTAPRSLAVTVVGGGDHAASAAIELARSAVRAGRRVLLVDADLGAPRLAHSLDLDPDPGLGEYLAGEAAPRDVLRTVRFDQPRDNIDQPAFACVPGGRPGAGASVAGARFAGLVRRLARAYELVIYSTPPILESDEADTVASLVDGVVLVAVAPVSRSELAEALELLDASRVIGVVGED